MRLKSQSLDISLSHPSGWDALMVCDRNWDDVVTMGSQYALPNYANYFLYIIRII